MVESFQHGCETQFVHMGGINGTFLSRTLEQYQNFIILTNPIKRTKPNQHSVPTENITEKEVIGAFVGDYFKLWIKTRLML